MTIDASRWEAVGIDLPYGAAGNVRLTCPKCTPNRKPGNQRRRDLSVNVEDGGYGKIGVTKYEMPPAVLETPRGLAPKGLASMRDHSIPCTTEETTESLPTSRAEAKAIGAKHFYAGPCRKGHDSYRFTSNGRCAECLRLGCQTYYERHKDRENARSREYAKRDSAGNRERSRRWYENNRDAALERQKRRREVDRAKHSRRAMEWYHANPEKASAQRRLRKARVRGAVGNVTAAEWEAIKARYGQRCLCCGATDRPLTMDHVVPIALGGTHTPDNVQPLCGPCNRKKYLDTTDYRKAVS